MANKNKAVVCCLLATSAIMLSGKKKRKHNMRSKKWRSSFWKVDCLEMMPSWYRQVNWGNCGIPCVNTVGFHVWTAQLFVWNKTGNDSSEVCAIACQNCTVYTVFPSGMKSHSKIDQFNWECIGCSKDALLCDTSGTAKLLWQPLELRKKEREDSVLASCCSSLRTC